MDRNLFITYLKGSTQIYADSILGFYHKNKSVLEPEYKNEANFFKAFIKEFNLKPTTMVHGGAGLLYTYTL